ncbi:MAG: hypothetical protein J6J36_06755 [Clostridia bacterium]|nr:hypothetical protein [Clostridia bacterium]
MGQRSQFYVQFMTNKNEVITENLSAMHLQWSWGWYSIQRAKQLLDFIQKETKEERYSMFRGGSYNSAKEVREVIYDLTQLNLEIGTFVKGIDLVYEELEMKFTNEYDGKGEDYTILREMARDSIIYNKKDLLFNADKHYRINPFEQDNNDGIVVIAIDKDGKIKYAFDKLQANEFMPITAEEYYKDYKKWDEEQFDEEDKKSVKEIIEFVDSFELLTAEELEQIFNKDYEW